MTMMIITICCVITIHVKNVDMKSAPRGSKIGGGGGGHGSFGKGPKLSHFFMLQHNLAKYIIN